MLLEKVHYIKPVWGDYLRTKSALQWLIKKDKICQQNTYQINQMTSLGKMQWYGIPDWIYEFEVGIKNKLNSVITEEFLNLLYLKKDQLQNILSSLENSDHKTICHGDPQMGNILLTDESLEKVYVIDWTQPHLTSICRDLAQLFNYLPENQKQELITEYKKEFNFENFDKEFENAVIIRDLSYLSWMIMMSNEGEDESVQQSEVE